jgi:hypothetical protein
MGHYLPYVHKSNQGAFSAISGLRDGQGKRALLHVHIQIATMIGRFPKDRGNFMRLESIREEMPGKALSHRTLRRHIKYLKDVGAIDVGSDGSMRLRVPEAAVVPSLCEYRADKGMSEYSYRRRRKSEEDKEMDENKVAHIGVVDDVFFAPDKGKICPEQRQILPLAEAKFASYKESNRPCSTTDLYNSNNSKHHPTLLAAFGSEEGNQKSPPKLENKKTTTTTTEGKGKVVSDKVVSEPVKPKRIKQPKNAAERRARAVALIQGGHLVNPLGTPRARGRRLKPTLTRPIGAEGGVTVAQLWAAFLELHRGAYGTSRDVEDEMQGTRENVSRYFDEMGQKFIDCCGYNPTRRDLYEYLRWFYDPSRLIRSSKGDKQVYHAQLLGMVYIRRFYDQSLRFRDKGSTPPSDKLAEARAVTKAVREAFDFFRVTDPANTSLLILNMVRHGVVLYAEYLHENEALDGRQAKKRIIDAMARYVGGSPNPSKAAEHVAKAIEQSRRTPTIKSKVWLDWESECRDMVELAVLEAERGKKSGSGEAGPKRPA